MDKCSKYHFQNSDLQTTVSSVKFISNGRPRTFRTQCLKTKILETQMYYKSRKRQPSLANYALPLSRYTFVFNKIVGVLSK